MTKQKCLLEETIYICCARETWELQQIASLSCVLVIIYELNNEKMNKAFWMNIENMQSEGLIEEKRTKIKLYFHSTF
ncbi:hypothetical protein RIR_jg31840.t1 [Rhizophagus irregularis DAOM 181602=DAOM 197198]|nr:hypothetical protein RIR_jg31840.t1 [Rhizophagus irregularis DAOM 181602=DAOM 197198]